MSKILIEGNKVIIDGHSSDLETCNTLTNLCDELSTSDKFRTVKYESGYGEFESLSENNKKKFVAAASVIIFSNDGVTQLREFNDVLYSTTLEVTSTGMTLSNGSIYSYAGDKVFLGFSNTANSTSPTFPIGYTNTIKNLLSDDGMSVVLYIVEKDPGYQVNIQSNDGTATLAQNTTVDSVVVTATGAQLKCGNTVKASYTYSSSKLFAGLATSANATAPKYKSGDTIEITAETTLYIVENIIIPEHHSSLTELFTNIAAVIREKTGDTASIVADDFPDVIRKRLQVIPFYLTFSSPNSFTLAVKDATKHWNGTLEYSTDTFAWTTWDGTTTLSSATSGSDNVLYLRGTGNTKIGYYSVDMDDYIPWTINGTDVRCDGNIETLLDYATVEAGQHPTMEDDCFAGLFMGCTGLTQAPALPATTLSPYCYQSMFSGCSCLTQAPVLPATTLALGCYENMFSGCSGLTQAPALPATTLANYCYYCMFMDCTSLTQAPALPATTLAIYCYQTMFSGCTNLTNAPALPATTLAPYCYQNMFQGCTSLTQAPALPVTTLSDYCYRSMFSGCTNLTQAPDLPATTLDTYCYDGMFQGCTSLTQAPALPATTLASDCYRNMFYGCTSLTQAPALSATTLASDCYRNMFYGCTSLTQASALSATTLADYCYYFMFQGCTSLTQAPDLPATTLESNCYHGMFSGCTSLTKAPDLPATTLADSCYRNMFDGCTSLTQIPSLPAVTLSNYCYRSMFYGCSKIKLSKTQTGEYTVSYRIPTTGTGTTASNALTSMFSSTGGTFKGTPKIDTTYYLSNTNAVVG